jgi:hypothetical protein
MSALSKRKSLKESLISPAIPGMQRDKKNMKQSRPF